MPLDRMVVFALLFLVIYCASSARQTYMTAYREEKLRQSLGRYLVTTDSVWWEILHMVKHGMILLALGQVMILWVEAQPWFVR